MQIDEKPLAALTSGSEDSESVEAAMEADHSENEALLSRASNSNTSYKNALYQEPRDKYGIVYIIFLYLGVACLLPWNFFITAKHYFDFKFRNLSLSPDSPYDTSNTTTDLQINFESYLSIASMASNLVFITIAMIFVRTISLNARMLVSLVPIIVLFIVTVVFVNVDTDSWQNGFFWFTLISAAFMVGLTAVMTGSVFGLSCLFPPRFTQAVMSGQAVGGTLSAVVMIAAIAIGGSPKRSAFGFFLTAVICTIMAMFAYFALYHLKYSKFYMSNQGKKLLQVQAINSDGAQDVDKGVYEVNVEIPNVRQLQSKTEFFSSILKKIWPYFASVCLTFLATLACFPAVVSLIKSVNYRKGDPWTDTYFSPVVCFLLFNSGDLIGRTLTNWVRLPRNGQKGLLFFLALLRCGFVPLFMLCNVKADDRLYLPVTLTSDGYPIALNLALGITNGYLGTLAMLYGPSNVDLEQAEGAGMVMTFGMVLGLAAGSVLSLGVVSLI